MATQRKEIPSVANPREKTVRLISSTILALIGISFVVPLAWVLFASFNPTATVSLSIPEHFTTSNYSDIATFDRTWLPLWNSAILSFGTAILTVFVGALAAYPLSRYKSRFARGFMYTILFGTCLPITALMVPVYSLFVSMDLIDSIPGIICFMTATSLPMAVWMLKNFMDSVPVSLEEAAWSTAPARSRHCAPSSYR